MLTIKIGPLFAIIVLLQVGTMFADSSKENVARTRVAVVTGGNKGIGFSIVKGLLQQFDGIVYLTARNVARGHAAVADLEKLDLRPKFHQLDVTDDDSIEIFENYLNATYGGLDVLVNNAGIYVEKNVLGPVRDRRSLTRAVTTLTKNKRSTNQLTNSTISAAEETKLTVDVNYFGLAHVCHALFPLLRPHARVVHMSSLTGHLSQIPGEELRARLSDSKLTEAQLNELMQGLIDAAKNNTHIALGWNPSAYYSSKVGVAALARIQQRVFDDDQREDLVVNAVHPGYVDTDLTQHHGIFSPDRGAQSSIYAALLPENTDIKGKFIWHDKTLLDWVNDSLPEE